jgi:molybdate transport system substrate-binding protein
VKRLLVVALAALVLPASVSGATTLNVFAAASLTEVFPKIDKSERYSFAGSDQLALQIRQGAPADLFASASPEVHRAAYRDGYVLKPVVFATNRLIVLLPKSNPGASRRSTTSGGPAQGRDRRQGRADRRLYAADPRRLGHHERCHEQRRQQETDVKGIVSKVALGEADAGFVYRTDAAGRRRARGRLRCPTGPSRPSATRSQSSSRASMRRRARYLKKVTSTRGRRLLAAAGFGLPKRVRAASPARWRVRRRSRSRSSFCRSSRSSSACRRPTCCTRSEATWPATR